jgi:O-antigen/teichoic acid export membrane protein
MFVLFIGIMAKAAIGPAEALLIMAGRQRICAAVYAGAFLCNIVGNLILIPVIGIIGAAIATAFAMTIEAVLLFVTVRKNLDINMIIGPVNSRTTSEIS